MPAAGRLLAAVSVGVGLGSVLATENALHIQLRPSPDPDQALALARSGEAEWREVRVDAAAATPLDGWLFTPRKPNGAGVILLHGVGDTRRGSMQPAAFLLRRGYTVLLADSRGHGASGGKLVTYGLLEARDIQVWADWLCSNADIQRLYGLGISMGASILIQSLPHVPRFRAIVAESPFSDFESIAYDRLSQATRIPRPVFWPIVNSSFLYTRLRYGLDLRAASPVVVVQHPHPPILLIHGLRDTNVPIRHSRRLHQLDPLHTELWEVPDAGHVGCLNANPQVYAEKVLAWFDSHR